MSMTNRNAAKPNIYQIVTDRIVQSLEAGVIPWERPWKISKFQGGPFPRNFRTGRPYRGINILLLWSAPFASPYWLTFKQARELKGSIRKGEKGTPIVFYKPLPDRKEENTSVDAKAERIPFVLCYHTVFNAEQCQSLTFPEIDQATMTNDVETSEASEHILNEWANRPTLHLSGENEYHAYYRPSSDSVHMPPRSRFVDTSHYYCTLFHELIHSTGHEDSETSSTARKN